MKNYILLSLTIAALTVNANAQTNSILNTSEITNTLVFPNNPAAGFSVIEAEGKESGSIEITLGAGGITSPKTGDTEFGLDFSINSNFIKKFPSLYIGIAQSVAWEPSFSGSTDIFADWSTDIWNETLYLNTGWSVGTVYDSETAIYRTGPELYLQYYTSDNAFIYGGVNYDFVSEGDNGLRYSFGIGLTF